MKLYCYECGKVLEFFSSTNNKILNVLPCTYCLEAEKREGYERGYEEGLHTPKEDYE